MNKKLLNTQIEALDDNHGYKICKFYQKHGFDIKNYQGIVNKLQNFSPYIYYGVNYWGHFNNREINSGLKTITLEEAEQLVKEEYTIKDLIEGKIAIKFDKDKDDLQLLRKILKLAFPKDSWVTSGEGCKYYHKHDNMIGYYQMNLPENRIIVNLKDIVMKEEKTFPRVMLVSHNNNIEKAIPRVVFIIKNNKYIAWNDAKTIEEAEKETNVTAWEYAWELEEKSRFPFELNATDAQSIINIACESWKSELADKWGKSIVLDKVIIIYEQFYKKMRVACTHEQNLLFDKIFGKD